MRHADPHAGLFLQQGLDRFPCRVGMLLVIRLQPGTYRSAHFGRLALPTFADAILPA
ncbi:MAG TPA: hypothetical protein VKT82_27575 [Ktedonobacterales bacterium]|nr:hypothetical protein [Ktedonobacterales bacterium]